MSCRRKIEHEVCNKPQIRLPLALPVIETGLVLNESHAIVTLSYSETSREDSYARRASELSRISRDTASSCSFEQRPSREGVELPRNIAGTRWPSLIALSVSWLSSFHWSLPLNEESFNTPSVPVLDFLTSFSMLAIVSFAFASADSEICTVLPFAVWKPEKPEALDTFALHSEKQFVDSLPSMFLGRGWSTFSLSLWIKLSISCITTVPFFIDSKDSFTFWPPAVWKSEKPVDGAVVSLFRWMESSICCIMAAPFSTDSLDSFTFWPLAVWKPEKAFGGAVVSMFCCRELSICCIIAAPFFSDSADIFTCCPLAVWKPEKAFGGAMVSLLCLMELSICCIMAAPFSIDSSDSFTLWPLAVWKAENAFGGAVVSLLPWTELSIWCNMAAPFSIDSADISTRCPLAVWKPENAFGGTVVSLLPWTELSICCIMAAPFSIDSADIFTRCPRAVWKPE